MASNHGVVGMRGLTATALAGNQSGRFGRLFDDRLAPSAVPTSDLLVLGEAMVQPVDPDTQLDQVDPEENLAIPAGYTYLGQFIDHDLTHDPVSALDRVQDPGGLVDFRTPRFDLDSLYGSGPTEQPFLYHADGVHLVEGLSIEFNSQQRGDGQNDLPRSSAGVALIGDPRNDENMIIAQLHAAFIRFHNRRADELLPSLGALRPLEQFIQISSDVRWHYQYVVLNDFLRRIVGDDLVDKLIAPIASGGAPALQFYNPGAGEFPYMPVEFAVAAYRLGHSMVRPGYRLNDEHPGFPIGGVDAGRIPIFTRAGFQNTPTGEKIRNDLRGLEPIAGGAFPRASWGIEWKYFFEVGGRTKNPTSPDNLNFNDLSVPGPQHSYKIDTELVDPLRELPDKPPPELPDFKGTQPPLNSLAQRNLLRGRALKLPSGQKVAEAMGQAKLDETAFPSIPGLGANLFIDAPLWYYILLEAETLKNSQQLGPVGGRIVAETFVGILWQDPRSFLNIQPWWKPTIGVDGEFGMQHLLAYTFDLANPRPRVPPGPPAPLAAVAALAAATAPPLAPAPAGPPVK